MKPRVHDYIVIIMRAVYDGSEPDSYSSFNEARAVAKAESLKDGVEYVRIERWLYSEEYGTEIDDNYERIYKDGKEVKREAIYGARKEAK